MGGIAGLEDLSALERLSLIRCSSDLLAGPKPLLPTHLRTCDGRSARGRSSHHQNVGFVHTLDLWGPLRIERTRSVARELRVQVNERRLPRTALLTGKAVASAAVRPPTFAMQNHSEEQGMARKTTAMTTFKRGKHPLTSLERMPTTSSRELVRTAQTDDGSVVREKGVTLVVGQPYQLGERTIVADAVYYLGDGKVDGRAGRLGGADKIAWRDPATGYECIIMRKTRDGPLSGYVGVPPGHPLFSFDCDAVPPDLEIEVHGGLSYSAICNESPSPHRRLIREAQTICHVPAGSERYAAVEHATEYRAGAAAHEKAWWFGFECDQVYDALPSTPAHSTRFLERETGAVIRDEDYVYDQVVDLAAQLRAIGDGRPKPGRTGATPPPLGLDPDKAR